MVTKQSKIAFILATMRQLSGRNSLTPLTAEELDKLSETAVEALRNFVMDMQADIRRAQRMVSRFE